MNSILGSHFLQGRNTKTVQLYMKKKKILDKMPCGEIKKQILNCIYTMITTIKTMHV